MKFRGVFKRLLMAGLVIGIGGYTVSAQGLSYTPVLHEETETSVTLEKVDKTKGVTYIEDDDGNVTGINLNGNSVIVKSVEVDSTVYSNIYIDENRNGIIDTGEDGEEPVALTDLTTGEGTTTNINASIPIYGVYQALATEPVVITYASKNTPIYGVYQGTAADLTIVSTGSPTVIYGVYESTVTGDISVTLKDGSCAIFYGVYESTVTGNLDITVDSATVSTLYGINSSQQTSQDTEKPALTVSLQNGATVHGAYAVNVSSVESKAATAVQVSIADCTMQMFNGIVNSSTVTAADSAAVAVDIDVTGSTTIKSSFYGVSNSVVSGNVDILWQLDTLPSTSTGTVYGAGSSAEIDGSLIFNTKNMYFSQVFLSSGAKVSGDGLLTLKNCKVNGLYLAYDNSWFGGDLNFTADEDTTINYFYGMKSSTVDGDVTIDCYGNTEEGGTGYSYFYYGVYGMSTGAEYSVGKSLSVSIRGGRFCVNNGFVYGGTIKGDVAISLKAVTVSSYSYFMQSGTIGGDVSITSDEASSILATVYVLYGSDIAGNLVIDLQSMEEASSPGDFSGLWCSSVGGSAEISLVGGQYSTIYGVNQGTSASSTYQVQGSCQVSIQNVKADSVYGVCGGQYLSDVSCDIKRVKPRSTSVSAYGVSYAAIEGNLSLDMDEITDFYYIYGVNYNVTVAGDTALAMNNCTAYKGYNAYFYLTISGDEFQGDVTVDSADTCADSWYGLCGEIQGDVTYNVKDADSTGVTYIINSGTSLCGQTDITLVDCNMQGFYGFCTSKNNDMNVTLSGGEYNISKYLYNGNGTEDARVNIKASDVKFTSSQLYIYYYGAQTVEMTVDDTCTLPDDVDIDLYSTTQTGGAMLHVLNDYYFSGVYPITADLLVDVEDVHFCYYYAELPVGITAQSVYFTNNQMVIPEGITVTAKEGFSMGASTILLEGSLVGELLADTALSTSLYLYVNGGTIVGFDPGVQAYYPVTLIYDENTMDITHNFTTYSLRSEVLFARALVSDSSSDEPTAFEVNITCTPKTGYQMGSAVYQGIDEDSPTSATSTVSGSDTTYSFDMQAGGVNVWLEAEGIQIVPGKTVSDPVAILNQATTEKAPLYDFGTVQLLNDAEVGEAVFALAEENTLPEGLTLSEDYKIYGTPTQAYEDGKDVTFVVTGKNGSTAELTLHIIVTEDADKKQDNQEGRIIVDDTDLTIHCIGNSVVVAAAADGTTAIYMDDDRDGVADSDTPVVKGDYSAYTLYGIESLSSSNPVRLTMTGGTLKSIQGANNASVTLSDENQEAVILCLEGGTVTGAVYGAYGGTIAGGIRVNLGAAMAVGSATMASGSSYTYTYFNNDGAVTIDGEYTLTGDLEVTSLTLSAGSSGAVNKLYIPEGVSLSVDSLMLNNYAYVYNRGSLSCDAYSCTSYGKVYMIGDSRLLPEDNTYAYVYYPITLTAELPEGLSASSVFFENADAMTEDGETIYYACSEKAAALNFTVISGYQIYYQIDGGEETSAGSSDSVSVTNERKQMDVYVFYVPLDISASARFGNPSYTVGKEYTEDNPLYDYTLLTISNDTSSDYGSDMQYALKSGSVLPSGLSLVDGKVIGTPTGGNGDSMEVTVVVTGRNGTSTKVTLTYSVAEEGTGTEDINDLISYDGSDLDLQGTSVVLYADSSNSAYVNIYLDADHDGMADNSTAFEYNGSTSINLSSALASLYGYRDTSSAYDGDISIYMYGGTIGYVYGAYGTSSANAVVNGKVSVYNKGATINNYLVAGRYATAEEFNLYCTAGTMYKRVVAAYCATAETVHFTFSGTALFRNTYSTYYMAVTDQGTVTGNVYAIVGAETGNSFNVSSSEYARFFGVYGTTVKGSVEYIVQGDWYQYQYENHFAYNADIGEDLLVDWRTGRIGNSYNNASSTYHMYTTFARNCTIQNERIIVADSASVSSSRMYLYYSGTSDTIQNAYIEVPSTVTGTVTTAFVQPYVTTTYPTESGYINNKGVVTVSGAYTLTEDLEASSLKILEGATLTVPEDITLSVSGQIDDYGSLVNNGTLKLETNGVVYVHENAGITNKGECNSEGIVYANETDSVITNDGDWIAEGTVYAYASGAAVVNNGTWVTNSYVYAESGTTITNTGEWNMNYSLDVYGKVDNQGSFTGKYVNASTKCVYVYASGSIENSGEWLGTAYMYLNGSFDNEGYLEINPSSSDSSNSNLYIADAGMLVNRDSGTLEINAYISNSGSIVNLGSMEHSYSYVETTTLGTVYMAGTATLLWNITKYNSNSSNTFYYPVEVVYPSSAVTGVTVADVVTSGADGDDTQYVKAGSSMTITVDGLQDGYSVEDIEIVYGSEATKAESSGDNVWTGTMPYEKTQIQVNVNKSDATQIEIEPNSYEVGSLVVGEYYSKIYDLSQVNVTGDEEDGEVAYIVSSANPLPSGLYLKDGIIYGTPKQASSESQKTKIIIVGKNLTRAEFTLVFTGVEKAVPSLTLPTLYAYTGNTLAEVSGLKNPSTGTFSWPDDTLEVTENCLAGEQFDLYFTPKDTENYDWSKLDASIGTWNADEGRVECKVTIKLYTATPDYTEPEGVTAKYGQTLKDVELPSDDNGTFTWNAPDTLVGTVGTHSYKATYTPSDTARYSVVTGISVSVTVEPADKVAAAPEKITAVSGYTIGQIALPDSEDGEYKWITSSSVVASEDTSYKLVFIPADTTNYSWTSQDGTYSSAYGGYVFTVTITLTAHDGEHTYGDWTVNDADTHKKECSCGDVVTEAHSWNAGVVTKAATATAEGTKTYTCTVCGATKTEKIAKLTHTHSYGSWTKNDASTHKKVCSCGNVVTEAHSWNAGVVTKAATATETGIMTYTCTVCGETKTSEIAKLQDESGQKAYGEEFTDTDTGAAYKVTSKTGETPAVAYTGNTDKNAKTITIPDTVTIGGVTYKVTEIAANAFKNNKKITKVTIGKNIVRIGKNAFYGCTKLKTVTIGKNVKYIGAKAFYNCKAMTKLTIKTTKLTAKTVGAKAFTKAGSKNYKKLTVKVPKKKLKAYKTLLKKKGINKKSKIK